jgi:RimJ/RimL family protein N-acetyltransferase
MQSVIPLFPAPADSLVLAGGYRAVVRPMSPASKPLIVAAMARLSPESSRRRFLTPRFRLSERELAQLTAVDGIRHYAFGICGRGTDGTPEGIAAGRFVRTDDDPEVAEIALTVIDEFQGQGLGKRMLGRLAAAAMARGVQRLRALIVPDNAPVLGLLRKYAPGASFSFDGEIYTADIPVTALTLVLPAAA